MSALVDLRSPDHAWREVMIGGGTPAVELVRLHVDRATNASVSLVRFPAGWSRPEAGHYPCAEEILVIEGSITVTGMTYGAGEYGYIAPFADRVDSSSDGLLVLAWFSGAPTWTLGSARERMTHDGARSSNLVGYRPEREDVQGRAASSPALGPRRAPGTIEVVDLRTWTWGLFSGDEPLPPVPGDVFQRWWD